MNKKNIGQLIAHWNVEYKKADRKEHFDKILEFVKTTGLDKIFNVKDVSFPDFDSKPASMGYPATRIDLVLKTPYRDRVYRHSDTKGRLKDLSVIHLVFRKQAGVYDCNRHHAEVKPMMSKCVSEKAARKLANWQGWDGFVCDCSMTTNGKYYWYKCRSSIGFSGESAGDSFNYAETWDDVYNKVFDAIYRIVHKFGIGRQVGPGHLMEEKLVIVSENEDWCGEWVRAETEAEMKSVGCVGDWLEWIFDHNFDSYPLEILRTLQRFDVRELVVDVNGFRTRFTKTGA